MSVRKISVLLTLLPALFFASGVQSRPLVDIEKSGVLYVGTTGDYKPMSYLNAETQKYEGFDAEMAASLADYLGVRVEYVPTTWKTLQADTLADKFDVALCGITQTPARHAVMAMSDPYLTFGKTVLVQKKAAEKFRTLADINKPEVRVMYNPGGTNEKFAKEMTPKATLLMHEQNAEIPGLVGEDKADVMITETMEARRYVRDNPKLAAPLIDKPFTENHFGVLMTKDDPALLAATNRWMKAIKEDGRLDAWEERYIK